MAYGIFGTVTKEDRGTDDQFILARQCNRTDNCIPEQLIQDIPNEYLPHWKPTQQEFRLVSFTVLPENSLASIAKGLGTPAFQNAEKLTNSLNELSKALQKCRQTGVPVGFLTPDHVYMDRIQKKILLLDWGWFSEARPPYKNMDQKVAAWLFGEYRHSANKVFQTWAGSGNNRKPPAPEPADLEAENRFTARLFSLILAGSVESAQNPSFFQPSDSNHAWHELVKAQQGGKTLEQICVLINTFEIGKLVQKRLVTELPTGSGKNNKKQTVKNNKKQTLLAYVICSVLVISLSLIYFIFINKSDTAKPEVTGPGTGTSPGNSTQPGSDPGATAGTGTQPGNGTGASPGTGTQPGNGTGTSPGTGSDPAKAITRIAEMISDLNTQQGWEDRGYQHALEMEILISKHKAYILNQPNGKDTLDYWEGKIREVRNR